ncbi:hypothetical protein L1I79_02675 [Strepomyces sp. STD 3.1]|uniref:hypothetical protein n=1 Tax=Streptomyces sp. NPDC058985 TaxID=3346684 RepID=UPI001F1D1B06|nr:hypothetical protein [Streptomyces sp. STD 3.1]
MSHASAALVTSSMRTTEAASAHPLLVVKRLDHSADTYPLASFTWTGPSASSGVFGTQASAPTAVEGAVAGAWI